MNTALAITNGLAAGLFCVAIVFGWSQNMWWGNALLVALVSMCIVNAAVILSK